MRVPTNASGAVSGGKQFYVFPVAPPPRGGPTFDAVAERINVKAGSNHDFGPNVSYTKPAGSTCSVLVEVAPPPCPTTPSVLAV
jgi:hypothetical protein